MAKNKFFYKMIATFSFAILIPSAISIIVAIQFFGKFAYREAQTKVNSDIEAAKEIFNSYVEKIKISLKIYASRQEIYKSLIYKNKSELNLEMSKIKREEGLDILNLIDKDGNVFYRTNNPYAYGENIYDNLVVKNVLLRREPIGGTIILNELDLKKESLNLYEKVSIEIRPTPHSTILKDKKELREGMAIVAGAPIFSPDKKFIGLLYGGILLNRNYEITDKIQEVFYKGLLYKGKEMGTVTIFQDNIRISTTVRLPNGERAISTFYQMRFGRQFFRKEYPGEARHLLFLTGIYLLMIQYFQWMGKK